MVEKKKIELVVASNVQGCFVLFTSQACLTTTKRVKFVETYYKKGDLNLATFRALRGENGPTSPASGNIFNKFEDIGSVTDILGPVHGLLVSPQTSAL